jgi:hypothetical protein
MTALSLAQSNFDRHIRQNPYPGRGLVIGQSSDPNIWLIVYWIMGRSTNSRNRRFVAEGGTLRTEPVDPKKVSDPSLVIYEAMLELPGIWLASNGDQTCTMFEFLQKGQTIEAALATREREPDAPNYTPRISAVLRADGSFALGILKASPIDPAHTDRFYYYPSLPQPGFGFGLTTYSGDGDPLPSFSGDPLLLPLSFTGSSNAGKSPANQVLEGYWKALYQDNRVSLAVKQISLSKMSSELLIRNQY